MDGGARWAAVYGAAQSRTRLKQLSSSSYTLSLQKVCELNLSFFPSGFLHRCGFDFKYMYVYLNLYYMYVVIPFINQKKIFFRQNTKYSPESQGTLDDK